MDEQGELGVRFSLKGGGTFTNIPTAQADEDFELETDTYAENNDYHLEEEDEEEEVDLLPTIDSHITQDIKLDEDDEPSLTEEFDLGEEDELLIANPDLEEEVEDDNYQDEDETFTVAPATAVKFQGNNGKINSSKTYSLKQIDAGGNYNV